MLPTDVFIANEAHWLTPDIVYLVFVRGGMVAGARVGGQLLAGFGSYHTDPATYARPDLLRRSLQMNPLGEEFSKVDRKSFRFSSGEILEARVSRRRALWTAGIPNSGTVILVPRSGRRRRLILLGHQDIVHVNALLISAGIPTAPLAAGTTHRSAA